MGQWVDFAVQDCWGIFLQVDHVVFLSFWQESVSFFFVEYFGVSEVFLWYSFGGGDGGTPFCPCFRPGHYNFSFFPIDLGVKGS